MVSVSRSSLAHVSPAASRARILAIDYGRQRIGLAISDELGLTASPLPVMRRRNGREDVRRLQKLVREHGVALVLVGNPVHLSGRASEMADEAAQFAGRIEKELKVKVELRDERLTSWEAEEIVNKSGGGKKKKRDIDSLAAAIILREYLDAKQSSPKAGGV